MTREMEEAFYNCVNGDPISLDWDDLELAEEAFTAGYQAALPKWTKIEDIPDDWKDGRRLFWLSAEGTQHYDGRFDTDPRIMINAPWTVTHAMLPPIPPKEGEG